VLAEMYGGLGKRPKCQSDLSALIHLRF
jgi:hypothetical protein